MARSPEIPMGTSSIVTPPGMDLLLLVEPDVSVSVILKPKAQLPKNDTIISTEAAKLAQATKPVATTEKADALIATCATISLAPSEVQHQRTLLHQPGVTIQKITVTPSPDVDRNLATKPMDK